MRVEVNEKNNQKNNREKFIKPKVDFLERSVKLTNFQPDLLRKKKDTQITILRKERMDITIELK